jgi:hypothetical protein
MKKIVYFLALTLLLAGCNKNDDDGSNNALPPATQTGENIFACKVDGKNFVHQEETINCFYQIIDGEYYFGISGDNYDTNPVGITLGTIQKSIQEEEIYQLLSSEAGNAGASVFFKISDFNGETSETNPEYTGELHITKFDPINQIVSGTFWFDVQHPVTGERVEIRDGRFDAVYGM